MDEAMGERQVLVIDDDRKILQLYQELLTPRGFTVTPCPEGDQVVTRLKTVAYDLVLLDIQMPGIEGTDLLPLIKKICPKTPVILVSAYCDESHAGYYHALGAFEVVSKPFSHEVLIETIMRAVDHQQERIPFVLTNLSLREGRDQLYRKLILTALRKADWNQVKAAELLGVSRYCLIRWLKKLGIAY